MQRIDNMQPPRLVQPTYAFPTLIILEETKPVAAQAEPQAGVDRALATSARAELSSEALAVDTYVGYLFGDNAFAAATSCG